MTKDELKEQYTIYINISSSRCGACGKDADYRLPTHSNEYSTWDFDTKTEGKAVGCGTKFVYVASDYIGLQMEAVAKNCRPDLIWNGYENDGNAFFTPPDEVV